MIDVHCHLLCSKGKNSSDYSYVSFADRIKMSIYLKWIGMRDDLKFPKDIMIIAELYEKMLLERIDESQLGAVVAIALDGIYENGILSREKSPWFVDNENVFAFAKKSSKVFPGASINPLRKDWEEELDKCIEAGTVLIKWLPGVMGFNPIDKRIDPFYKKVSNAGVVLLTHVGYEKALRTVDQNYSDLENIETALYMGVKVIAAHCCGGGFLIDDKKNFSRMVAMAKKYSNLYFDVSGMSAIHRKQRLINSIKDSVVSERLVYGSDYPIPIHRWAFRKELRRTFGYNISSNPFDLDIQIKKSLGMDEASFNRGYEVLKINKTKLN